MSQINIHPEMQRDRPLDSTPAHGWLKALSNMMADDQLPLPHLHPRIFLPSQAKAPGVVPQLPSLSSPCPPGPAFPLACSCPSPGAHSIGPASVSYCWPLQHIHLHPLGSCILPPNPGGKHWLDRGVFFPGDHNLSPPPLHPSATLSLPKAWWKVPPVSPSRGHSL